MQELQLNIGGTHEDDCKKPEETFTDGQRNTQFCFVNANMIGKVLEWRVNSRTIFEYFKVVVYQHQKVDIQTLKYKAQALRINRFVTRKS